ncbi:MAG TPA: endonuclease III [bacterium]|nr:endonuclease III [bacterium]HPQ65991.1 endonuclease III [bacterium]
MSTIEKKSWGATILRRLAREYPAAGIALEFRTPLQLLVATILSAQSTDRQINKITRDLFRKYRSVGDYARADRAQFEEDIRSSGFFRNKAAAIIASARLIEERFGGKVPETMDELLTLPGVARKTANIVLWHAFGKAEGIAVDTHVKRLAGKLGLSGETAPDKIERDLLQVFPRRRWGEVNTLLIVHGRQVCIARRPRCGDCVLADRCPSAET